MRPQTISQSELNANIISSDSTRRIYSHLMINVYSMSLYRPEFKSGGKVTKNTPYKTICMRECIMCNERREYLYNDGMAIYGLCDACVTEIAIVLNTPSTLNVPRIRPARVLKFNNLIIYKFKSRTYVKYIDTWNILSCRSCEIDQLPDAKKYTNKVIRFWCQFIFHLRRLMPIEIIQQILKFTLLFFAHEN